ncbi:MAG: 3-keto-disaccharide hydrolase [Pirellulaceae bacterium]
MRLLLSLTLLLSFSLSSLAEGDTPKPNGFRTSLFNGKDLAGWHATGCVTNVEDGKLVIQDGDGFVRTDHRYTDFILELDWKARRVEKYDSGIYFRSELPTDGKPWPKQYQINLLQGGEGNCIGVKEAVSKGLIKSGDWNHFKLTVIGDKAEMEINGKPAWKVEGGIEGKDGYIGIQVEVPGGGQFEFKDIFVTELGHEAVFNGKDLAGWEGAGEDAAKCWKVEEEQIVCTGQKGPWLRSQKEFGDFNLRLDYKLRPGGNSGVYVRVPADGNHHGDGAGVEIQVLDDKAERYKDLKPYQFTGSVYAIAPAKEHVGREAGQWNSLEIDVKGTRYRIIHNGVTIIDAAETEFPDLKARRPAGFLGLQNHSEEVWYKNLRIGPPMP